MELNELVSRTIIVSQGFRAKYDDRDHFIDLVEEVGELANALKVSSGRKITNRAEKHKNQSDVTDAICDILFELFRISHKQNINLESEYLNVLNQIETRIKQGEFN